MIISFAYNQIEKRKKQFNLYIKTKKFTQMGEAEEEEFLNRKFECVQNQIVLTNSSAKIIKDEVGAKKYTAIGQFYANCGANLS